MLIGCAVAGSLALMMTPPLLSLVQPPGEHPPDYPKKDHPGKEHPADGEGEMAKWMEMNQKAMDHEHLKHFVGEFNTVSKFWMAPDSDSEE